MIHTLNKTVTTAGTRVAVASARTPATWISFQGKDDNTGACYAGDVTVTNASGAVVGHSILPGDTILWPEAAYHDLSLVYLDADNSGDIVIVTYGVR